MDGGQVALSGDAETQASVWMSDSAGARKLFFVIGKPGTHPPAAPPAETEGTQTHASVIVLDKDRALAVYEQDMNTVRVAVLARDGKLAKTFDLGPGKYPRLVALAEGGAVAAWESDSGVKVRKINADELK